MSFHGRIHNGVVVLDEAPSLPEGTPVRVEVIDDLPIPVGSFPSIGDLIP